MSLQVLLVDDDEVFLHLHKMVVKRTGLSSAPLSFLDGKYAFEYLEQEDKPAEEYLILLDINMPLMDGWKFLEAIQNLTFNPSMHIIVVTSSTDKEDRNRAFQYNQVIDYLEKPLSKEVCNRIMALPQIASYLEQDTI